MQTETKPKMAIKTYVVLRRDLRAGPHGTNATIVGVRLTNAAAQKLSDKLPGTYVEKHVAIK